MSLQVGVPLGGCLRSCHFWVGGGFTCFIELCRYILQMLLLDPMEVRGQDLGACVGIP